MSDKDTIYRQDAIDALDCINGVEEVLRALPSAQPERQKGEWVRNFDGNEWYWFCSNCKEEWYEEDLFMGGNDFPSFCPNCGCRMNGGEEDG